jgi:hypothetical protein
VPTLQPKCVECAGTYLALARMHRPLTASPLPGDLKPTQASPSLHRREPKSQTPSFPSARSNDVIRAMTLHG